MPLFEDSASQIEAKFPTEPFKVGHNLPKGELFGIERLVELAQSLPAGQIEWNSGDASISQDPDKTPSNGLSPEETVRNIEQCNSWLVLKNVQSDPEYARVLHECLDEVEGIAAHRVSGISDRAGFIFVSSPNSVTPFHMDPEHNFLLQMQGSKTLQVFDQRNRNIVAEEHIENTYFGDKAHRNLEFRQSYEALGQAIVLNSQEALHIPIHAPHWVKNGPTMSVSFSITFRSDQSRRAVRIHTINARLRRRGLKPSDVGRNALADSMKDLIVRGGVKAKSLLRRESVTS